MTIAGQQELSPYFCFMTSTKLSIPQKNDPNPSCRIVGVLEKASSNVTVRTTSKPLALILHGAMGHKDYLFQRKLATRMPMDSLRIDFRGNHESGGEWKMAGGLLGDVDDIQVVAEYMKENYGYDVAMVVAHSKGSIVACKWICSGSKETSKLVMFVNISGRYRMQFFRGLMGHYEDAIREQGYGEWKVKVAGKQVIGKVYPEDIDAFASWDNSYIEDAFPKTVDVLTLHGLADEVVPPYDALIYARVYGSAKRSPGTHTLHLVEGADHNYSGHSEIVVTTVIDWMQNRTENKWPNSYVWQSGRVSRL